VSERVRRVVRDTSRGHAFRIAIPSTCLVAPGKAFRSATRSSGGTVSDDREAGG
jgi:hypothetical protein